MIKYVLKRLCMMVIVLFFIVSIAFFAMRLMPGNPYDDNEELSPAMIAILEEKLHLNKPLHVQYFYFIKGVLLENDWGVSLKLRPGLDAFSILSERIPVSLKMNILSLFVSIPLGIIAGSIAAMCKNKWPDYLISFMVVVCISVPSFVFSSMLQYFPAYKFNWFPIIYNAAGTPAEQWYSLVLPVMAISFGPIASICRYLRGELIETLGSEYMLLARTKGLKHWQAVVRHAFRNSMVPLANIIIPMITDIMGGSMVTESIFGIPGVGGILVDSITVSDYPLAIAALLFYSFISVFTILLVDISYGIIDPRIRLGAKK